jgi:type IV secretory pathway TraG/TraD family ATPase VirD4
MGSRLPTLCLLAVFLPATCACWLARQHHLAAILGAFSAYLVLALVFMREGDSGGSKYISLGGLTWKMEDFRRHWGVIGKSGSGKTLAFFKRMMQELCRKVIKWGGVAVDEKGDFWIIISKVFAAIPCSSKLINLRCRKPGDTAFKPKFTINLIGDRSITFETWAQIIVDVAVSQGQKSTNPHFKTQARLTIADILKTLSYAQIPVTLNNAYRFMKFPEEHAFVITAMLEHGAPEASYMDTVWKEFWRIDPGELSGIKTSVLGYLAPYATPEVAEIFSAAKPNVVFRCIDDGCVLVPTIPQAYLTERSYITAFFKMLFYFHGLRRFDEDEGYIEKANDLVLMADEGHSSLLPSEEGLSDLKTLDKLRAAKCTCMFGMQDYTSAIPNIGGKDRATVFFANLGNHAIFSLSTADGRKTAADIIDKETRYEDTFSSNRGHTNVSRRKAERYLLEPHIFKNLKKFQCVLQHAEGAWVKTTLPAYRDDGKRVESWFWKVRLQRF